MKKSRHIRGKSCIVGTEQVELKLLKGETYMLYIFNRMTELLMRYQTWTLPIGVVLALALCFTGYKRMKVWIAGFGFCTGLLGGWLTASRMFPESLYAPIAIGLLIGVILGCGAVFLVKAGIFVFAAVLTGAAVLYMPLMDRVRAVYLPQELGIQIVAVLPYLLALTAALAAGAAAVKLTRPAVILVTGITGAYGAVAMAEKILMFPPYPEVRLLWTAVLLLLIGLGTVVQFFTTDKG